MAGRYIDVTLGELYLKKIYLSVSISVDNLDLTATEIDYAETWAENEIDSRLGLRFDDFPATPLLIRDLCLMFTAFKLRQFLLTANAPNLDQWTQQLKAEADSILLDIFHGRRSVIMPDLSFHPRYPGPSGGERFTEQPETSLRRFFTNMDREWYEMQQAREQSGGIEPDGIEQAYVDGVYGNRDEMIPSTIVP